jgi:RND superfamily putative drug exporter
MQLSDPPSTIMLAGGSPPNIPSAKHEPEDRRRRPAGRPVTERIACWSARHRIIALVGWLVMVGGAVLAGHVYGTQSQPQYDPGQSGVAERMLHRLNVVSPPSETVLIQTRGPVPGRTLAAAPVMTVHVREATLAVVAALRALPGAATDIQSPFGPAGRHMIGPGGRSALVTFQVAGPHSQADTRVVRALDAVAAVQSKHPDLIVSETGGASVDRAATAMLGRDFHKAELTSVPLTLVLLLLVFGALIAASIPVILAGTAVTTTVSLLAIPSRWLPIGQGTSEVVLIIGMAVGIDYTLFYLRREREERAAGAGFHDALRTAAATSGRAIVVSGLTVMISLAGLLFTGIDMFTGFAIGTMLVVGVAVVGSLTALPALLALLGPWADRARVPFLGKGRTRAEQSRLWSAVVERVVRHPVAWGGLAVIALAALAAPALGMRVGQPAINLPSSLPVVRTLDHIQRDFPGGPAPAQVVVAGPGVQTAAMQRAITGIEGAAVAGGPIHGPVTVQAAGHGRGMVISVPLAGTAASGNSSPAAIAGLRALRGHILPATVGKVHGVSYAVTGSTAGRMDYRSALRSASPLVFGIVAALAFVLLLLAFRSLAIPLVSIGLNLLSVGAAYGLITIIFQQGHLERLLGFTSFGGIIAWVPLFMFVFLFGLSMDYHVFVLSRIAELKSRGLATIDAVTGGISRGAGVVTSAAVIMVAVFSIFASLSTIDLKMIGVGLAFAVFIDATVVRGICVPAALVLLGERSWYLPAWLRWLPKGISLDA